MDWDKIKSSFRWDKIRIVLRWAGGVFLSLLSVMLLFAFIAKACEKSVTYGYLTLRAADVVFMWVVILGAGAPGVLLLRKAILGLKKDGAAPEGEDEGTDKGEGEDAKPEIEAEEDDDKIEKLVETEDSAEEE